MKYINFIYNKKVNKTCQSGRTCCNKFIKNDVYEKFKKNRYLQELKKKYNLKEFDINEYLKDTLDLLYQCINDKIQEIEKKGCNLLSKIKSLSEEKKDILELTDNFKYDLQPYIDYIDEKIKEYIKKKEEEEKEEKKQPTAKGKRKNRNKKKRKRITSKT